MRFPADVLHVASARHFAVHVADEFGATVDRDDLALIVGELAANAAEHQTGEAELVIRVHPDGGVDVEVTDQSPDIPAAMERAPSGSASYRGLAVVSAISHSWGVVPEGSGKRVWARLAPPAPPPTANR
jgi:anti-sigma regulatory factor (Ser/Thr protein kinase)